MMNPSGKKKTVALTQNRSVKEKQDLKLPEDLIFEIKACFNQYNGEYKGGINRHEAKSVLTNFGFHGLTGKEIDEVLFRDFEIDSSKQLFTLSDLTDIIKKKWFNYGGRMTECEDIFKIFDKKGKGAIGLNEIKAVFAQYLDFTISDQDINEFIQELGEDGNAVSFEDFAAKLGYQ